MTFDIINREGGATTRNTIFLRGFSSLTGNILNHATVVDDTGSAMTLSQGGGDTVTINEDGIYITSFCFQNTTSAGVVHGIFRNTTSDPGDNSADALVRLISEANNITISGSFGGFLSAGDVLRVYFTSGGTGSQNTRFSVAQIRKF